MDLFQLKKKKTWSQLGEINIGAIGLSASSWETENRIGMSTSLGEQGWARPLSVL